MNRAQLPLISQILPEALTSAQVRALLGDVRRRPLEFEMPLAGYCTTWLRWEENGRDVNDYQARRAARVIADALNAQVARGR